MCVQWMQDDDRFVLHSAVASNGICILYKVFSKAYPFNSFISYHFLFLRLCAILYLRKHLFSITVLFGAKR